MILVRTIVLIELVLCTASCGRVTTELNVPYGEMDGHKLLLDISRPTSDAKSSRAAVILVHGGAWSAGDKSECSDLANWLANQGYVAFSINYRLVTPTADRWPAQLDDAQRAIRWVRANASSYGIDPHRVAAMGGSAGGHIVACLGTSDTRDNADAALAAFSSRPTCVIVMAGPTDLTDDLAPKVKEGAWTNEQVRILLGDAPNKVPKLARSASPLFQVDTHSAPALIVQGKSDEVVPLDHAERFAAALKHAGVPARLLELKGGHGFDDDEDFEKFIAGLSAFLKEYLEH